MGVRVVIPHVVLCEKINIQARDMGGNGSRYSFCYYQISIRYQ